MEDGGLERNGYDRRGGEKGKAEVGRRVGSASSSGVPLTVYLWAVNYATGAVEKWVCGRYNTMYAA